MSEALKERAVLRLLSELSRERRQKSRRRRIGLSEADCDEERLRRLASYESRVDAFAGIGALSAAEAAAWRRRFEWEASEPAEEELAPDGTTGERVEQFLAELFSEKAAQAEGSAERRVRSFARTVWALEAVGAIRMDEAKPWVERMQREHGLPTREEQDREERARTCSALELRRVIAAPLAIGGLRISHLEIYADGALIYALESATGSTACGTDPRSAAPYSGRRDSPLKVADDLGTVYEARPYHGFAKALTPAIPNAASRLHVTYAGAAGEIALR